ncbi:MAG TPA: enoyl-CoA hydratase/isomerase family protein [Pirellulales bacterium]|nr:enoyl-CoA hydratase/isomerase family protein [Pirellulales bacterium]
MIELEHRGSVTVLHMVRGRGNALDISFLEALIEALSHVERSECTAVVLTGKGRIFGAGVDLPALVAGGPDYVRQFIPLMTRGFERLVKFPKPLVAATNGHAIAGGAILMLACDVRLLARGEAKIGLTEVLVGVQFPAWALEIARFATPPQHFPEMILTGRTWLPEQALARGLVDELVEPEQLLARACAVAEELSAVPPATYAATKLAVRRPMIDAAERLTKSEDAAIIERWCSPAVLESVGRFAAKSISSKG